MKELNDLDNSLIFNHINGSLTEADQLLFDKRYQEDTDFRAEVAAYEDAKLAAFFGGQSRIKDLLKEEAAKYQAESAALNVETPQDLNAIDDAKSPVEYTRKAEKTGKIVSINPWILRGIAASLLIGITWLTMTYFKNQTTQNHLAQHLKPLPNDVVTYFRGNDSIEIEKKFKARHDDPTLQLAKKAFDYYSNKQYTESIAAFNSINNKDDTIALYRANAYLATNQTDAAIMIFNELSTQGKGYTKPYAEWYLALAHLKKDNTTEGKSLLERIKNTPNHPFAAEAQLLLNSF